MNGRDSGGGSKRTRIDKIDAAPPTKETPTWVSILKAFNPFGPAAEAYAKTLAYRIEVKRLELEAERVREQSKPINSEIDKTYKLKMEELQQRRLVLARTFDLAEKQLENLHVERMHVLKIAQAASAKAMEDGVPFEERQLFKELALAATQQLPSFGQNANQSLKVLVKALPPVEMPSRLLDD